MKPFSCYFAVLLGALVSSLVAQPTAAPLKPISVTLRAVSIARGINELGVMQDGGKIPLYVPPFQLSVPVHYEGPPEVVFTQTQVTGVDKREVSVATAVIPQNVPGVLILLSPAPLIAGQYTTRVIPHTWGGGSGSGAKVVNLSSRAIAMTLNGANKTVTPGQSIEVALPKGKLALFIPRLHKQADDQPDICRETFTVPAGGRLMLLVQNTSPTQSANDEAVTIIPLVEEAAAIIPSK